MYLDKNETEEENITLKSSYLVAYFALSTLVLGWNPLCSCFFIDTGFEKWLTCLFYCETSIKLG
jgi:hypothetical protein